MGATPSGDIQKANILEETAIFQAQNIFRLLGYETDEEIPIDVFKDQIFNGDEETRATLRQFCCLDWAVLHTSQKVSLTHTTLWLIIIECSSQNLRN